MIRRLGTSIHPVQGPAGKVVGRRGVLVAGVSAWAEAGSLGFGPDLMQEGLLLLSKPVDPELLLQTLAGLLAA